MKDRPWTNPCFPYHDNLLEAENGIWRAIGLEGVVGEAGCEASALLRNRFPALLGVPQPARILARRLDQLAAELGMDRQRLLD